MNDSHAVLTAAIAAGVSLLVAIMAAAISLTVQTRNNYLQAVTAERSKWIDKLRSNISLLSGMIRTFSYKNLSHAIVFNSPEYISALDDMSKMISLIRLQLNPDGNVDRNLLRLIARVTTARPE